MNTFFTNFLNATDVCDPTGQVNSITKPLWTALEEEFTALSAEAQGLLAKVTYTHGEEQARSVEDAMDRYDYIIAKVRTFADTGEVIVDFIHRILAGNNPYWASSVNCPYTNMVSEESGVILLVAIALISGLIATSFFILRRKRYQ